MGDAYEAMEMTRVRSPRKELEEARSEIARLQRSEKTLLRDYETALDERVGLQESIGRALGYMDAGVYSVARDELRAGLAELDKPVEHHPRAEHREVEGGE